MPLSSGWEAYSRCGPYQALHISAGATRRTNAIQLKQRATQRTGVQRRLGMPTVLSRASFQRERGAGEGTRAHRRARDRHFRRACRRPAPLAIERKPRRYPCVSQGDRWDRCQYLNTDPQIGANAESGRTRCAGAPGRASKFGRSAETVVAILKPVGLMVRRSLSNWKLYTAQQQTGSPANWCTGAPYTSSLSLALARLSGRR